MGMQQEGKRGGIRRPPQVSELAELAPYFRTRLEVHEEELGFRSRRPKPPS